MHINYIKKKARRRVLSKTGLKVMLNAGRGIRIATYTFKMPALLL